MSNGPWRISMKKLGGQMLGCRWTKLLPREPFNLSSPRSFLPLHWTIFVSLKAQNPGFQRLKTFLMATQFTWYIMKSIQMHLAKSQILYLLFTIQSASALLENTCWDMIWYLELGPRPQAIKYKVLRVTQFYFSTSTFTSLLPSYTRFKYSPAISSFSMWISEYRKC